MWIQVQDSERGKSRGTLPSSQHFEGYRGVLELRDGTKKSWQASLTHTGLHTHTRWLVHSWSTFGARMNHMQHGHTRLITARTWGSHHFPPCSIFCTSPRGPHPNGFSLPGLPSGSPEIAPLRLPRLWSPITLWANLRLTCGLQQSCSSCRELSKGMSHVVYS